MKHTLRTIDDSFFDTAPIVVHAHVDVDASASAVFEALGSDRMWSWFPGIDRLVWLTPRPHEAGCVRRLRVARAIEVEEEFYRWDENERATFRVTRADRPWLRALAEDFRLTAHGAGTRLTWTMAIEPAASVPAAFGALAPLLRPGNARILSGIRGIVRRTV